MAIVIEGTWEEIKSHADAFNGHKLRVIIDPEPEEDLLAGIPPPPFAVRDREHLIELLTEGVNSPLEEATDDDWTEVYALIDSHREKPNT
jgi:hypothetical protein